MKQKCIFLDRDGVLNVDRVDYVYRMEDFIIPPGVGEALKALIERAEAGMALGLPEVRSAITFVRAGSRARTNIRNSPSARPGTSTSIESGSLKPLR